MNRQASQVVKAKDQIKLWNIAVGDTVRVISGPSKGIIGKVEECLKHQNKLVVSGVNVVKKVLPLFLAKKAGLEIQNFEYPSAIHYSNVRLIGEIPSAIDYNGPKRRVEIKRVNKGRTFYNKDKKLLTWRRWIPGENVFLPWPKQNQSLVDGLLDTRQPEVKLTTYIETLHKSPIPFDVQHELRNKYSRFRRDSREIRSATIEDNEGIEIAEKRANVKIKPGSLQGSKTAQLQPETIQILSSAMSRKLAAQGDLLHG